MQKLGDVLAISCSGLCALHCLLLPMVLVVLPTLGAGLLNDEVFHAALLWAILPSSIIALFLGCFRHKDPKVVMIALCGLIVIVVTAFVGNELAGELGERLLTLLGSGILIFGHYRNFALCRADACDH